MLSFFNSIKMWLQKPVKFDLLNEWLRSPHVKVLDVGCGNHSPTKTKRYYPLISYYGLDKHVYNLNDKDFALMDSFYLADLETDDLSSIPDEHFDIIIFSHVIEHLNNREQVIGRLIGKCKRGGIIYVETPHPRSVHLPSLRGTLNFFDDPTHKRLYFEDELRMIFQKCDCEIVKQGTRRSMKRILLSPLYLSWLLVKRLPPATALWDITGFAQFIIAKKR